MSNDEDTSSEPRDDTSLDTDNQVTRDAKWRSEIDRIAAEAIRNYEALVEQAAKACPPSPPRRREWRTWPRRVRARQSKRGRARAPPRNRSRQATVVGRC